MEEKEIEAMNLNQLLVKNDLPFYAKVYSKPKHEKVDELYFYKIITTNCLLANSADSDSNKDEKQTILIPFGYQGLFEIINSYLPWELASFAEHEIDLMRFLRDLNNPRNIYVSKDLKVFQLIDASSSSCSDSSERSSKKIQPRWTVFRKGTICKAIRPVIVEYDSTDIDVIDEIEHEDNLTENNQESETASLAGTIWTKMKWVFCCKMFASNTKSDSISNTSRKKRKKIRQTAIEFRIIEDFRELIRVEENQVAIKPPVMKTRFDIEDNICDKNFLSEKCYYLPINSGENQQSIDFIEISLLIKNKTLKPNYLQTTLNFVNNKTDNSSPINCRLVLDKAIKHSKDFLGNYDFKNQEEYSFSSLSDEEHENNFNEKYKLTFEILEKLTDYKLLLCYSLKLHNILLLPIPMHLDPEKNDSRFDFSKLNAELDESELVKEFSDTLVFENVIKAANKKLRKFDRSLNKLETNYGNWIIPIVKQEDIVIDTLEKADDQSDSKDKLNISITTNSSSSLNVSSSNNSTKIVDDIKTVDETNTTILEVKASPKHIKTVKFTDEEPIKVSNKRQINEKKANYNTYPFKCTKEPNEKNELVNQHIISTTSASSSSLSSLSIAKENKINIIQPMLKSETDTDSSSIKEFVHILNCKDNQITNSNVNNFDLNVETINKTRIKKKKPKFNMAVGAGILGKEKALKFRRSKSEPAKPEN